jgi:3-methylfumaryl-CoA hydratase
MSRLESIKPGDLLPERAFNTDTMQLFLYNAAIWNAHRIHFDHPYATLEEGYPGLVNAGPLMGDWLSQCVLEWLGDDGRLTGLEYSNRKASIIGETLVCGGRVLAVDRDSGEVKVEVSVLNENGEAIVPGTATVSFGDT